MKKILIATHNPGKIIEYKEILGSYKLDFILLGDLGIREEPEEDGRTFEENALKKVEFYSKLTDLPVLAEDSGFEVDYLNGEPGVHSRRWPGYKATDKELIDMVLTKLNGVPKEKRGAQFRVVMAFKKNTAAKPVIAEGILRGIVLEKPAAKIVPGFPFRPLLYLPQIDKVLGAMDMKEEAKIAHRRIAIAKLLSFLACL